MYFNIVHGELTLLVIGGEMSYSKWKTIIQDVELLDPFDKDSDCIKPPDLPFPRKCLVSEYLDDKPFIIGGGNRMVKYATSLVLINNTWMDTPVTLNHSRYCAVSTQPKPKTMWVVGGDVEGTHKGMTSEILNQSSLIMKQFSLQKQKNNSTQTGFRDTVNAPADVKYVQNYRKCVAKINSTHLFLSGYKNNLSYIVDASTLPYTFKLMPEMKFGSHNGGACATIRDSLGVTRLLVAGGGSTQLHKLNLDIMTKTEFFDFSLNKWIEGPELPRMFYMGGFVQYPDERGLVLIGGEDLSNYGVRYRYFSDLLRYNQTTNKFEYLPNRLNIPRSRFGAMLVETTHENCTIVTKITTSDANSMLHDFMFGKILICVLTTWTILVNISSTQ